MKTGVCTILHCNATQNEHWHMYYIALKYHKKFTLVYALYYNAIPYTMNTDV